MRTFWSSGSFVQEIFEVLTGCPSTDSSGMFEDMVASELQALGYAIIRQHWVPNRGDGKRGKVDLVAEKGPVRAAIELDRRSPRQKSIFKVNQVKDATFRVVFCREEKRSET